MPNVELEMTLDEAVGEVLNLLTGMDLHYIPELDRFRSITKFINRATRAVALEAEWSCYYSEDDLGVATVGIQDLTVRSSRRPRVQGEDALRLVDDDGQPFKWIYFLPRNAVNKYPDRMGIWAAFNGQTIHLSRPFHATEAGYHVMLPVMREPVMLQVPETLESVEEIGGVVNPDLVLPQDDIKNQLIDFPYPDLIIAKAAHLYAQADPVMQPRVQTLEAAYKDLMYALTERDMRNTDDPYLNDFDLGLQTSPWPLYTTHSTRRHPHSDDRLRWGY